MASLSYSIAVNPSLKGTFETRSVAVPPCLAMEEQEVAMLGKRQSIRGTFLGLRLQISKFVLDIPSLEL